MTVKELIAELGQLSPDAKVYLPDRDDGPFECESVEEVLPGEPLSEAGVHLR